MATAVPTYEDRQVSIGRVFQRAISTVAHNPLVVLGISLILGATPSVIMNYVTRSVIGNKIGTTGTVPTDLSAVWGAMLFSWVVAAVIGAIVQGGLTRATVAENEGHRASFGECLAAAGRVLVPLIIVGFLFAVAVGVGFILLVVPGIILMVMWSVAGPAVVVERDGVGRAFGRSQELTKGVRWKIFGLFLVLLVIYILLFAVLGMIGLSQVNATSADGLNTANLIGSAVMATLLNLIWGTIQPALYIELRQAKEGGSLENLEQVFA